jgi:uncharacterized ferredoxin-like protein
MAHLLEEDLKNHQLLDVAQKMLLAARTAPKGRGRNTLHLSIITGKEIEDLSSVLHQMGNESNTSFYHRDADNLLQAGAILLLGTSIKSLGLGNICQLCGFENCEAKDLHPQIPCIYNVGDLHLAAGSAVALAADFRIDNRIMFSVGKAALKAKLLPDDIKIALAIPLSATSKNPFFDRPAVHK